MHRGKLKPGATWRIQVKVTVKAGHGTIRDKAGLARHHSGSAQGKQHCRRHGEDHQLDLRGLVSLRTLAGADAGYDSAGPALS